ncbi:FUSC family protein [Clostridium senegalense]|uniref:FUSC family protein n=1 Tax=Clostridium senegalense TaxID=1465809 RepID=UPI000288ABCC|nr:aromatic acid exporter family protein [Clostridium senegalense]
MKKIGMRNIKTAVSVFICIVISRIFKFSSPFYACIAAVICMQSTVETSFEVGKNRLIGTTFGAVLGVAFSYIMPNSVILTAVGISLLIYLCDVINKNKSTTISCIVFVAIMTNLKDKSPFEYGVNRFLETALGIIIAVLVNKYICPYYKLKKEKKDK